LNPVLAGACRWMGYVSFWWFTLIDSGYQNFFVFCRRLSFLDVWSDSLWDVWSLVTRCLYYSRAHLIHHSWYLVIWHLERSLDLASSSQTHRWMFSNICHKKQWSSLFLKATPALDSKFLSAFSIFYSSFSQISFLCSTVRVFAQVQSYLLVISDSLDLSLHCQIIQPACSFWMMELQ